ncbi:MAG: ADP-ribosylglycohydrolase family protein [Treponema sp.]|jgi:ADP-ribosylglycohydrolase|nr:ADP-ribosylglycohydrolase family protein [Treponema sp.]
MDKALFTKLLYGGIIGDAMGVPYEFREKGAFRAEPDMAGYGTYCQPPGTWSDDTSLTLLLMEALTAGGGPDGFIKRLRRYYQEGYMTPDGRCFDIGHATLMAANGKPDPRSEGNGSLMRALPLVRHTWDLSAAERESEIGIWSAATHPNERAVQCCLIYVELMRCIITTGDKKEFHKKAAELFQKYLNENIDIGSPGSNGRCTDTLRTAVRATLEGNDYSDIILETINLGGDTDTNAMVAGTMAAAVYPINEKWLEKVRCKDLIGSVIDLFWE